jgi:hypothetical protein
MIGFFSFFGITSAAKIVTDDEFVLMTGTDFLYPLLGFIMMFLLKHLEDYTK